MKWLNPLHHFSGCSKVGGGFLKKYKVWDFKTLVFIGIISQIVNKDATGSTRVKTMIEKVTLHLSACPLQMPVGFFLLLLIH